MAAARRQHRGHRAAQPRGLPGGGGEQSIGARARPVRCDDALADPRQDASHARGAGRRRRRRLLLSSHRRRSMRLPEAQAGHAARHRRPLADRTHRGASDRRSSSRRTGGAGGGRTAIAGAHQQKRATNSAGYGRCAGIRRSRRRGRRLVERCRRGRRRGPLMDIPPRHAEPGARGSLWRSALFSLGMALSTMIFAPLSVLTFPLPYRWRYGFITQWTRFNLWWLRITCRLYYVVEGLEHVPAQPAIVLAIHQSTNKTKTKQHNKPPQVWLLKRELLWVPFNKKKQTKQKPNTKKHKTTHKTKQQLLT